MRFWVGILAILVTKRVGVAKPSHEDLGAQLIQQLLLVLAYLRLQLCDLWNDNNK